MVATPGEHAVVDRSALPERELGLQRGDGMDGLRRLELLDVRLGHPDRACLAGGDDLGHRAPGLLDGHVGVGAVELVEVDVVGAEALERRVDHRSHVLGATVAGDSIGSTERTSRPHLVASTAPARPPSSARPTSCSLV